MYCASSYTQVRFQFIFELFFFLRRGDYFTEDTCHFPLAMLLILYFFLFLYNNIAEIQEQGSAT